MDVELSFDRFTGLQGQPKGLDKLMHVILADAESLPENYRLVFPGLVFRIQTIINQFA